MASTPAFTSPTPTLHEHHGLEPALAPFSNDPKATFSKNKAGGSAGSSPLSSPRSSREGLDGKGANGGVKNKDREEGRREVDGENEEGSGSSAQLGRDGEKQKEVGEEKKKDEKKDKDKDPNEVTWDGPDDPENPQNWSQRKKWAVTLLASLLTLNVTFASSGPSSGIGAIATEFGVSRVAATLTVSLFLAGYCVGPFIWAPASEMIGRRPVFVVSLFAYSLLHLGGALGHTFGGIIVTRLLAGIFSSSPLTNSGGLIADIWDPVGRGTAMSFFSAAVFLGPALAPMIAGFVTMSYLGWRWIFYILLIFSLSCSLLALVFLPETLGSAILTKKAKRLRKEGNPDAYHPSERADRSLKTMVHATVLRPFDMLLHEPILVLITIYISVIYGLLYACFELFPIIWSEGYGFNLGESGLIFLGVGLGTTIGAGINIAVQQHYKVLVPRWHGTPPPEERLIGAMIAGPCLVIGMFMLGWTGYLPEHIPWWVPLISTVILGTSFTLVFIPFLSYLVDCYMMYAASALAANTIVRSAVGAALPLVIAQWVSYQGLQWVATIVGCVGIALAPSPFLFYRYGHRIRRKSKFAPGLDLKIRDQVLEEERKEKDGGKEKA